MTTLENLVSKGMAIATPQAYITFTITSDALNPEPGRMRYTKREIFDKHASTLPRTFTYKPKDRYFVISGTTTPYSSVKAYIQMAGGKITKDVDKADHIVMDDTIFANSFFYDDHCKVQTPDSMNDALLISSSSSTHWYKHIDHLITLGKLPEGSHDVYRSGFNFYDQNALAALAVQQSPYADKIVRPYDLGIATGSISALTEDSINSFVKMLRSGNKEDRDLANQMIGTFDFKSSELLTWQFCKKLNEQGRVWYLNRRLKSVREFIENYFDKYAYLDSSEFFALCKRRKTLTPEIFNHIYKDIQQSIKVYNNPDIWTIKFEMKDEYKNLIRQHRNAENKTSNVS